MPLSRQVLVVFMLVSVSALCAVKAPVCTDVCQPDSTSTTFLPTIQARPLPQNARGTSSVKAVVTAGVNAGSQAYNYAVPIIHLQGVTAWILS